MRINEALLFVSRCRYEYRTAEAFVKDFELMKNNAIKFNGTSVARMLCMIDAGRLQLFFGLAMIGSGAAIADEAVNIYEAVKEQVDASQTELKAMEEAVKEQLSGKPKKKKKKKKATGKKAAAADGIGVEVNLGDLDFLDDIGSDSERSAAGLLDL